MEDKELELVKIFLKSGQTIEFKATGWEFKWSNLTGEYLSYSFKGIQSPVQGLGIDPTQIAGYIITHEN